MKTKIAVDLPTAAQLTAGLTLRDVHPEIARAEQGAAAAERALEGARRELGRCEREVAEIPARVRRGEMPANALEEAIRAREAAALMVRPAELAVDEADARLALEQKNARAAVEREVTRRRQVLERTVAQVAPVLGELRGLELALSRVLDPQGYGLGLEWPRCWPDEIAATNAAMSFSELAAAR